MSTQSSQTSAKAANARYKDYRKQCAKKWAKVLDVEAAAPILNEQTREATAVLLENQRQFLLNETTSGSVFGGGVYGGGSVTNADSYATGDNRLPKMILPMIRRTFPETIANEVVGVQPMSGPISLAFAFRFKYEKGPLHEARAAGTLTNPDAIGPHYGVGTARDGVNATDMTQLDNTTSAEMGYNYLDNSFTGRRNELINRVINPTTGAPWTDLELIDTYKTLGGTATTLAEIAADTTGVSINSETVTGAQFLADHQLAGGKFTFSDQDSGFAAMLGDYEATGRIPKTSFTFEKKSVEAGTRRIGTSWTMELEQDVRNMNGIDVETEFLSMMSYELTAEIDRELIVRMMYAALSVNEYSYWDAAKADARWMAERDRAFYQYLVQQSNRMAVRNRRGPANFIIATPDVCTLLETLPTFAVMPVNGSINTNHAGIAKLGTVGNGRFTVYRDTRTPVQDSAWINDGGAAYTVGKAKRSQGVPDFALLGYKGDEYWDAGIIYCPYIPIMMQRVVDPVSFEPTVGLLTRYGVVDNLFGSSLYYHVVLVSTLSNQYPTASSPANTFPQPYSQTAPTLGDTTTRTGYGVDVLSGN